MTWLGTPVVDPVFHVTTITQTRRNDMDGHTVDEQITIKPIPGVNGDHGVAITREYFGVADFVVIPEHLVDIVIDALARATKAEAVIVR